MTSGPYAKIIADSVSEDGYRVTTMEVRFHRFVLAEFNTHRVFSRNSASSRARPFAKVVAQIRDDPAVPLVWPHEQKGMQGGESLSEVEVEVVENAWLSARDAAVRHAGALAEVGLHKSLVNRLLEPWGWHTVVVTATEWDNFFEQRCSPLAQPEIRVAAEMMREVYQASIPDEIVTGEWHLPYIEPEDRDAVRSLLDSEAKFSTETDAALAQISAARCARVSYLTQDGKRDIQEDLNLYQRLVSASPWHGSPLEHVATPWTANVERLDYTFRDVEGNWRRIIRIAPKYGNLLGWRQLRLEIEAAHQDIPHNSEIEGDI